MSKLHKQYVRIKSYLFKSFVSPKNRDKIGTEITQMPPKTVGVKRDQHPKGTMAKRDHDQKGPRPKGTIYLEIFWHGPFWDGPFWSG